MNNTTTQNIMTVFLWSLNKICEIHCLQKKILLIELCYSHGTRLQLVSLTQQVDSTILLASCVLIIILGYIILFPSWSNFEKNSYDMVICVCCWQLVAAILYAICMIFLRIKMQCIIYDLYEPFTIWLKVVIVLFGDRDCPCSTPSHNLPIY